MNLARRILMGAGLGLALAVGGCKGEIHVQNVQTEQLARERAFSRLYTNPIDALLGKYKGQLSVEEIMTSSEKRMGKPDNMRDDEDAWKYDGNEKYGRGYKLADKLKSLLRNSDYDKTTLLFVNAGSNHMYALGTNLQPRWNVYFFAEYPCLGGIEEYTDVSMITTSFYQFCQKKPYKNRNLNDKPNAIIWGDSHRETYPGFRRNLPKIGELQASGVRKIIYAKESFVPKRGMSLARLASVAAFEDEAPVIAYFKEAQKAGIKVEVMGIEESKDYFIGDESK